MGAFQIAMKGGGVVNTRGGGNYKREAKINHNNLLVP